jgi:hypothetical protein
MNLFSAFSFGSLIKTFLPGLVLFFVFLVYIELFGYWIHGYLGIFEHLFRNPLLITFISIPTSIFLGVILNSIVFSGLSGYLLENRHEKNNRSFYEFRKYVIAKTNEKMSTYFDISEQQKEIFKQTVDPRYFFLHKESLANLMYLRESYWYYLEFQLNTLVAITFGMPAFVAALFVLKSNSIIELHTLFITAIILVIAWFFFAWLCMRSALFNLDAHRKKELSLLLGAIFFEIDGDDIKKKI